VVKDYLIVEDKRSILMPFYGISLREAIRKVEFSVMEQKLIMI